jgi:nucleoside-diphosphate-sugar epimerase
VGIPLCERILREGWYVRCALRTLSAREQLPSAIDAVLVGQIGPDTAWSSSLEGIDTIVHLAARTHVMREDTNDPLTAYRLLNVAGTERFARAAAEAGVKRFLYLSSVKVNGEGRAKPYIERDSPAPEDAYGVSKWEAEQALHKIAAATGMEIVIVRPPLVYGPGVKANFLSLIKAVNRGIPLPFSSIRNRRSMIYLGNLVDAIITCIKRSEAAGKTYLVSDGEDTSTPELVRRIAHSLGRSARLFPCPQNILRLMGRLTGKSAAADRLFGSLTIDSSKIRRELDWRPPFTMNQGLQETAEWFLKR